MTEQCPFGLVVLEAELQGQKDMLDQSKGGEY